MLCNIRLYPYFMGGLIIILPFMLRISRLVLNTIHGRNHFLASVILLSVVLFGFTKKVPKYVSLTLGIMFIHAYLNQVDFWLGFVVYQYICFGFGVILLLQAISNFEKEDVPIILNCLSILAVLQCTWIICEHYIGFVYSDVLNFFGANLMTVDTVNGLPIKVTDQIVTGSLTNSNYSGALLAIAGISLFRRRWWMVIPFVILALALLHSTLPVVTFAIGFLIWGSLTLGFKLWQVGLASILVTLVLGGISLSSNPFGALGSSGRVVVWKQTINNLFQRTEVIFEYPDKTKTKTYVGGNYIVGQGLGYFAASSRYFVNEVHHKFKEWLQIHNEYLELLYAFGLIGIIYFVILLFPLFLVKSPDPLLYGSIGAVMFNCIGHFTLHIASTAFISLILIGLAYNQNRGVIE